MIIGKIEDQFGKMTVTRGKEQVFLGMNIRYTENRTAIITPMKEYLRESILDESELNITRREAATPASKELFEVSEKATKSGPQSREIPQRGAKALVRHSKNTYGHVVGCRFPVHESGKEFGGR